MIDNAAILIFGLLIIYTVFRAVRLDRQRPWFTTRDTPAASGRDQRAGAGQPGKRST